METELEQMAGSLAEEMEIIEQEMVPEAEVRQPERSEGNQSDKRSRMAAPSTARQAADEAEGEEDWINTLGKLAEATSDRMRSLGFRRIVEETRGRSDITDSVGRLEHPAAALLEQLRTVGAKVELSELPWTIQQLEEAVRYGSHPSCQRDLPFLAKELVDFVRKGFFLIVRYEDVKDQAHLRVAPMSLVPQRDRRDRIVVDYSYWNTNAVSLPTAPDSMQFGRALQRILQRIYDADPKHGPVYLIKVDVADGFYRVWLQADHVPKLGVILPDLPGHPKLVALPIVLPMGWTQSPPYFCALTETVADVANRRLATGTPVVSRHRLEQVADTSPPPPPVQNREPTIPMSFNKLHHHQRPLSYIDVFVDDFLGLAQGDAPRRNRVRRALLQSFDEVFRPLEEGEGNRQEPASVKKMRKGDAAWATAKVLLGWLIDSIRGTIELPVHRQERLQELLTTFRGRKRSSLRDWQKLLGELRSMTVALPGAEGLFSMMQAALVKAGRNRVRLNRHVHAELDDWAYVSASLAQRPTSIAEVVMKPPSYGGDCDAAKAGMGGVAFNLRRPHSRPVLWRSPFPAHIQARVVSYDNPTGDITNSDLELAGAIGQHDIVAQQWDVRHTTIATRNDNSPTVGWTLRGSVSRDAPVAYLLRLFALHRRVYRYTTAIEHLSGDLNRMADDCSRLWHLTDSNFLAYFNTTYPQRKPWRMCNLRPEMNSALISALRSRRSLPESWLNEPQPTPIFGNSPGNPTADLSASTPFSDPSAIRYQSYKSTSVESATAGLPYKGSTSSHVLLKRISGRLGRRSPDWVTPIRG